MFIRHLIADSRQPGIEWVYMHQLPADFPSESEPFKSLEILVHIG
ncbi:hypothetical protein SD77_1740 [Bacillus badius]|uniref:Uncharacterized protein n=1 Tax=Bacillus badius TaxID=1455 RepID=A0ABR5AQV8_BACBA|nr:hypothetical protein SD77_1740 [Bacillus badius]